MTTTTPAPPRWFRALDCGDPLDHDPLDPLAHATTGTVAHIRATTNGEPRRIPYGAHRDVALGWCGALITDQPLDPAAPATARVPRCPCCRDAAARPA